MKTYKADWKNAGDYPPIGCEDAQWLAWEFLRRNSKYAEHVDAVLQLKAGEYANGISRDSDSLLSATECTPPALAGETAVMYHKRMSREDRVGRISKPKIVFTDRWSLSKPVPPDMKYDPKLIKFVRHEVKIKQPTESRREYFKLSLAANEIMLRFRLDMNFAPQLISALARLDEAAQKYDELITDKRSKLRGTRKDSVLRNAHVWLRCYDAYKARKQYVEDPTKKRKRTAGPAAIVEQFHSECSAGTDPRATVNSLNPPDWNDRAADYIDGMLYLKLLVPTPSAKNIHAMKELLRVWSGSKVGAE